MSVFTAPNFANKNNKGCMLKINKNLEVAPQIIKSIQGPPGQNTNRTTQWINEK